ncbi:B-box type zinc finger family protein [Hibiscus syriacus]|uniref:Kinesin-like protein n=1 Tax=Hibiscus syriacus TaxID=106335 RepID=A0A6A2XCA8_HIBSY|nr:B-box type zinc finger family protein [Hibiscus syriacus]
MIALRRSFCQRGTIVEKVTEESLKDWNHLKELLAICEAQRRIGDTSLNERSSRSHQIIRLTIESSAREFLGKENCTTLAASVNFIDLAGSERASQALSTGTRLKEGCHINRSLLTLSTVVRKLSKGRRGHINHRDSKLTRILQPCLGGNARTAIICTLSPARSHVEQTRNTLLFACCAKEITTKAQVNVVMSDKALVKHLQRELARLESELGSPVPPPSSNSDYAALLRKKDLQIEKDLPRMIGSDQDSGQLARVNYHSNQRAGDTYEDDYSESESSCLAASNQFDARVRKFNPIHCYDIERGSHRRPLNDHEDHSMTLAKTADDPGENNDSESRAVPNGVSQGPLNGDGEANHIQEGPELSRSWSCRADVMDTTSSSYIDREHIASTRPNGFDKSFPGRPDSYQMKFPSLSYGPDSGMLSRNDSLSSIGSASIQTSADEQITSIHSFVAGLKKQLANGQVRLCLFFLSVDENFNICTRACLIQFLCKCVILSPLVRGTGIEAGESGRSIRDAGLNPMCEAPGTPVD